MTAKLLELPKLRVPDSKIPEINPVDRMRWFKLTPTAKGVELLLKSQYNQRCASTGLTTKMQLQQYLDILDSQ